MGDPRVNESDEQKKGRQFSGELTADTRTVMTKQKGCQFFSTKKGLPPQVKAPPPHFSEQGPAENKSGPKFMFLSMQEFLKHWVLHFLIHIHELCMLSLSAPRLVSCVNHAVLVA